MSMGSISVCYLIFEMSEPEEIVDGAGALLSQGMFPLNIPYLHFVNESILVA